MGVLSCERRGCDNVMCDHIVTVSPKEYYHTESRYMSRYICDECLSLFLDIKNQLSANATEEEVCIAIDNFFDNGNYISGGTGSNVFAEIVKVTRS